LWQYSFNSDSIEQQVVDKVGIIPEVGMTFESEVKAYEMCYGGPDLPEKEEGKWLSEIASMLAASASGARSSAITAPGLRLLDQESKTRSLFSSCNKREPIRLRQLLNKDLAWD